MDGTDDDHLKNKNKTKFISSGGIYVDILIRLKRVTRADC